MRSPKGKRSRTSPACSASSGSTTTPTHARARLEVRDELLQPFGIVHGGVFSTLVESVCSRATALAVYGDGMVAMGQSINVSFLRPITEGSIEVLATRPPPRPHHLGLGGRDPRLPRSGSAPSRR